MNINETKQMYLFNVTNTYIALVNIIKDHPFIQHQNSHYKGNFPSDFSSFCYSNTQSILTLFPFIHTSKILSELPVSLRHFHIVYASPFS